LKKTWISVLIMMVLVISACGSNQGNGTPKAGSVNQGTTETSNSETNNAGVSNEANAEMITYQSENGPVDIPANPQRIIGLTNAPNIISIGGTLVAWMSGRKKILYSRKS
jgi:iron complex transport system substrate-binding protein